MAVEFADLYPGIDLRVFHGHPTQRDVPSEDRRAGSACHHSDLLAADVDAITGAGPFDQR